MNKEVLKSLIDLIDERYRNHLQISYPFYPGRTTFTR